MRERWIDSRGTGGSCVGAYTEAGDGDVADLVVLASLAPFAVYYTARERRGDGQRGRGSCARWNDSGAGGCRGTGTGRVYGAGVDLLRRASRGRNRSALHPFVPGRPPSAQEGRVRVCWRLSSRRPTRRGAIGARRLRTGWALGLTRRCGIPIICASTRCGQPLVSAALQVGLPKNFEGSGSESGHANGATAARKTRRPQRERSLGGAPTIAWQAMPTLHIDVHGARNPCQMGIRYIHLGLMAMKRSPCPRVRDSCGLSLRWLNLQRGHMSCVRSLEQHAFAKLE